MAAQFRPQLIIHAVSVLRDVLRQPQGGFFFLSEIAAVLEIAQVFDLLVCPAVPSRQDGVRSQSILTSVDLRGSHDQQLFELRRYSPRFHNGAKMRDHGAHDLRPVGHRAEHVRNVAARLHEIVEDFRDLRGDTVAI
jgi:hypothetical protein